MKKILLTTTALVAAGFFSSAAIADQANDSLDPRPAPAGVTLGLGGYYKAAIGFVDSDIATSREYAVKHDVEVYFTGETTLNNGLTVGARIELDTNSTSSTANDVETDERFLYFRGNFGEVRAGNEDSVRRLLSVQAPEPTNVFSVGDGYINMKDLALAGSANGAFNTAVTNGLFDGENDTVRDLEFDSAKVIYFTPSFNGFTAGVSFTPEVGDTGFAASNGGAGNDSTNEGDVLAVAALYEGQFQNVGVKVSAGYETTDNPNAGQDDRDAYSLGLQLGFNAFTVGGSYGKINDQTNGAVTGLDTKMYDLGVMYAMNNYAVGVSYSRGTYDLNATDEAKLRTWQLSGSYALAQGIDLVGAIQFNDLEIDGDATATGDQESTAVLIGTSVRF